mgnify:CR=1 FL=1
MGKALFMALVPLALMLLGAFSYFAKSTAKTVAQTIDDDSKKKEHLLSGLGGLLIGAFLGSSVGVAAFGGAIAGTVPGGILGAVIGYLLSKGSAKA